MSFLEKGSPWDTGKSKRSINPWDTGKPRMDYGMTIPLKIFLFVFGFIPWLAGVIVIIVRTLEAFKVI